MRKRMTSVLLTLVMLLSLVPAMGVTASAAEPEWTTVNTYKELQDAVTAKKEYIKLGRDIDTTNFHYSGSGITIDEWLTFKGQTCTLDLNGKTLTLITKMRNMGTFMRVYSGSNLTIKDSSSTQTGEITCDFDANFSGDNSAYMIHVSESSLTLEGGTFRATSHPYATSCNAIQSIDSNLTIKNGVKLIQPDYFDGGGDSVETGSGYALRAELNKGSTGKIIIDGGEFDGCVKLIGSQAENGSVQINGGTFKKIVQVMYAAEENNSDPAVAVNDGTFEGNVYLQGWPWKTSLYMPYRLNGGTFYGSLNLCQDSNMYASDKPKESLNIALGLNECFGYSAIAKHDGVFTAGNIHNAIDWETQSLQYWVRYKMLLKGSNTNPVRIIPNAWGMKSVTLDGKKIDYAKDWTGEWKRVDNDQDYTLVFEWYPLSDEMKNAGYTYDAKYLLYRTNSSTEPTPTTVDTSKNTLELKINKGTAPGGYSYDLRLDLKKDGGDLSSSTNQHIVKLVVDPAQEIDTRTPIDSVTLNVPKLSEGATSGGNFTLSGTNTGVNTINTAWENIPESGAVAGNFYVARITLTAEDGYAFNTKTQVNLNGDYSSKGSGIDNGGAGMTIYVSVPVRHEHTFSGEWQNLNNDKEYHFKTCSCGAQTKEPHNLEYNETLDKYQCICGYWINGTKTEIQFVAASPRSPIDGESPSNYTPEQWVHNIGKNYTVVSIDWKDEDGNAVTTFESGKIYKGTVTFKADDEFKFDKDRIQFDRIFNTSTTETVEGYNLDEGATTLIATFKLKDNTVVRPGLNVKVKLPTLNDKIGQSFPAAKLVDTTLPGDVELTTSVYENILDDPITGSVAPNKTYFYAVWLKLGNNDSVEAITKKYNVSYTVTDGGDAEYHTDNVAGYGVLARYQTPNAADTSKISSVALTVTAPKYGEAPATTATGANDTLYTVGAPEWSPAATDGKFGAAAYTVSIPVTVKSGYSFDANCIYTVNGYLATYADGKVSYTFPALTAPHEHSYSAWTSLNDSEHYRNCTAGDDPQFETHKFNSWTKVDDATHKATCTVCNYEKTENHSWKLVGEVAPTVDTEGSRSYECSATGCKATKTESIPKLIEHTVTVKDDGNGKASANHIKAVAGTEIKLTATANSGYHFKEWQVVTGSVTINDNKFTMPDGNVEVKAIFEKNTSTGGGGGGVTTYPITVKSAKNGDVTASHKTASKGTTVTLTVAPDKGYALDTLTVLDGKDKEIKLTEKNGKYTFTMPASKVTVEAMFKAAGNNPFIDVPAGSYYEDAVIWAVDKGITTGTSATTFNPNGICTRAQAVTFLWRAAGSPAAKSAGMPFTDVKAGSYYYDAVLWAVEQGITKGTSDTTFSPDATCSRAQIVTFLWRANGSPAVSGNSAFTDVAADAYYAAAVTWAEKNDITGGIGGGLFGSNNNCTRAQIVTFIYRNYQSK